MTRITALLLFSAALGLAGPARADNTHAQTSLLRSDTSARHHEMSSRHRPWRHDRVAVFARACPGFTVAPTPYKTYGDKRWPYVNWRGACDSLYAPGPAVTFVSYGSY
jgi:hypothetical protein